MAAWAGGAVGLAVSAGVLGDGIGVGFPVGLSAAGPGLGDGRLVSAAGAAAVGAARHTRQKAGTNKITRAKHDAIMVLFTISPPIFLD